MTDSNGDTVLQGQKNYKIVGPEKEKKSLMNVSLLKLWDSEKDKKEKVSHSLTVSQ